MPRIRENDAQAFIERSRIMWANKFDYSLVQYVSYITKVKIICPVHGVFEKTPKAHLRSGCAKCSFEKVDRTKPEGVKTENFIRKAKLKHGNKFDYSKVKVSSARQKVIIICPIHGEFRQRIDAHLKHDCYKCSNPKKAIHTGAKALKQKALLDGVSASDKKKRIAASQTTIKEKIALFCDKHGVYYRRANGRGSKECSWCRCSYTQEEFLTKCKDIHGDKYSYEKTVYTGIMKSVEIKCYKHGYFSQRPESHLRGAGCPKCRRSKGEDKIEEYLKYLGVQYQTQVSFDWGINSETNCKYKYDFFLNDFKIIIEYDGEQHFKPVKYFKGRKNNCELAFEDNKRRDAEKNKLASINNVKLYRISYIELSKIKSVLDYILLIEDRCVFL